MKNCKISGNFGEIEIMTDSAVSTDFDTLVTKQTTPNYIAGLDYTAFMINKEKESKSNYQDLIELKHLVKIFGKSNFGNHVQLEFSLRD